MGCCCPAAARSDRQRTRKPSPGALHLAHSSSATIRRRGSAPPTSTRSCWLAICWPTASTLLAAVDGGQEALGCRLRTQVRPSLLSCPRRRRSRRAAQLTFSFLPPPLPLSLYPSPRLAVAHPAASPSAMSSPPASSAAAHVLEPDDPLFRQLKAVYGFFKDASGTGYRDDSTSEARYNAARALNAAALRAPPIVARHWEDMSEGQHVRMIELLLEYYCRSRADENSPVPVRPSLPVVALAPRTAADAGSRAGLLRAAARPGRIHPQPQEPAARGEPGRSAARDVVQVD